MNKTFLAFLIAIPFTFSGCKKDAPLKSSAKSITYFSFNTIDNKSALTSNVFGIISNDTIIIKVPQGTLISNLVPDIIFKGKVISPSNKTAQNFLNPVHYIVTAEDGSASNYIIIFSFLTNFKIITGFVLKSSNNAGLSTDISGLVGMDTIALIVPPGTDIKNLIPTITFSGKNVSPESNVKTDFSLPVNYIVTAEDGTYKAYTVMISPNVTVYITSYDGYLYALNAATGNIKWKFYVGSQASSPIFANGVVYSGAFNSYLYAIDGETGLMKWKFYRWPGSYTATSVYGGKVYFGLKQSGYFSNYFCVVDERSGSLVWEKVVANLGYGSISNPTIVNGTVFFTEFNTGLNALDAVTGELKWSYYDGFVISNPAVADGLVFISTEGSVVSAIDATTGKVKWAYREMPSVISSPTVFNGVVYIGGNTSLYAININNGSLKWKYPSAGNFSSPVVTNGLVYAGNNSDWLYATDAVTGLVIWKYNNSVFSRITASSPAVANGIMYVNGGGNNLYAFDAITGALKWKFQSNGLIITDPCVVDAKGLVFYSGNSGDQN